MSFKPNSFVGKWLLPSSYSFDKKASMAFYLFSSRLACGDEGVRTPDLVVANHALSQLSYIPSRKDEIRRMKDESNASVLFCFILHNSSFSLSAVGVLGFEPRTSALSELRSSQLSYTPLVSNSGRCKQKSQTHTGLALSDTEVFGIERQPSTPISRMMKPMNSTSPDRLFRRRFCNYREAR